jgi:DEAD/DEAH box helicase domain-containing protein
MLERLLDAGGRDECVTHLEQMPARPSSDADWPLWAPDELVHRWRALGVPTLWTHQRVAADHAHAGRNVVVATGTGSGKSLAYQLPALTAVLAGRAALDGRGATVLYLAPTKALAADQARALRELDAPGVRVGSYDGDTPMEERDWVRRFGAYVLTNPDMLHAGILPGHARWSSFLKALQFVVIDEAHAYRGVFGAHVAQVIRRLRRVCASYGSDPVFMLASATTAEPGATAERLVGRPVVAVTVDGSPRGETAFALWEPPVISARGEHGAPLRRSAVAEVADLLGDLVLDDAQTVAFVRSRKAAEGVAAAVRERLGRTRPDLAAKVAAYRGGYLPEERRTLERALHDRRLLALASTNALELGVDIAGLDAVLLAGYPGSRASVWQQVGRAGRAGGRALAVLVARDDPLDSYLAHHPEALFGTPVEATVFDPDNPYVLAPHLAAAAAELPLQEADLELFGPAAAGAVEQLTRSGLLRRRPTGWFWTSRDRASGLADLRGSGATVRVVEARTGRMLGTVDAAGSHRTVHEGAVYVHQGGTYLVQSLDLDDGAAVVVAAEPDYTTSAREISDLTVLSVLDRQTWGAATAHLGEVQVTGQVVAYVRRRARTGEFLSEHPLDLPERTLQTVAVWWTLPGDLLAQAGIRGPSIGGALHAAEHAAIGLLPLFATCDRWDIGGLSHPSHPDTNLPTIFVHDGHPGGAGFAERGFRAAVEWLTATRDLVESCSCADGCPACVQSPKCGNGNAPLDKAGAARLLTTLLGNCSPVPPGTRRPSEGDHP